MKKLSLYLTFIIVLAVSCRDVDRLNVKPGIGIDNLTFLNSDTNDIRKYRGLDFVKRSGKSVVDGPAWACYEQSTRFINDSLGITFVFSTPCVKHVDSAKQVFVNVSLYKTPNACLSDNLCIGSATRGNVIKHLGEPLKAYEQISGQVDLYYDYLELHFSCDTLNWIKIYTNQKLEHQLR
ncbi:hypothetical protein [Chryseolinea sp. H1M3-3]|uniref:hypothetical protein n=1 Tax=Chryseolinea sp. H1M3-3 TaxID=3034144 RepID=UPI0023EB8919|nr:hypothetical protein [Chryseolinea sp. H1M3-3]